MAEKDDASKFEALLIQFDLQDLKHTLSDYNMCTITDINLENKNLGILLSDTQIINNGNLIRKIVNMFQIQTKQINKDQQAKMVAIADDLQQQIIEKEREIISQETLMRQLMEQQKAFQGENKALVKIVKAIKRNGLMNSNQFDEDFILCKNTVHETAQNIHDLSNQYPDQQLQQPQQPKQPQQNNQDRWKYLLDCQKFQNLLGYNIFKFIPHQLQTSMKSAYYSLLRGYAKTVYITTEIPDTIIQSVGHFYPLFGHMVVLQNKTPATKSSFNKANKQIVAKNILLQAHELIRKEENLPNLQGWIEKTSSPVFRRGRQNVWVIVRDYSIFYGKKECDINDTQNINERERKQFMNIIPLLVVQSIVADSISNRQFKIVQCAINGDKKHHQWETTTKEECDKWINGLNEHKTSLEARLKFVTDFS